MIKEADIHNAAACNTLLPEIIKAELRIRPHTLITPLVEWICVNKTNDAQVFLKLENEQHTGSFKARGSMNKILTLSLAERQRGVVTASTGNHGLGVARALREMGVGGVVFVPENADASKVGAIKKFGVDIHYSKAYLSETDAHALAKQYAAANGMSWISPYNDLDVIAGQGTIGVELIKQLPVIDHVFVTVGGGGLISGVAAYLKALVPHIKIIGCLPEASAEMYHSVMAGTFVDMHSKPSLSDGSAGGFEKGAMTFTFCQQLVDDWVLVSEEEIKEAIRVVFNDHHKAIEGAAGVAVAGFLKYPHASSGNTVIVICGGNIATKTFKSIL